jgi:hypothetical protein
LSTLRRRLGSNHRMLSTYLSTFRRRDLWLDQIAEPIRTRAKRLFLYSSLDV